MEENININQKRHRLRIQQRWFFGVAHKRETASHAINRDLKVNVQDQVVDADSLTILSGNNSLIRFFQFVADRYWRVRWHVVDVICLLNTCLVSVLILIFNKNVDNWEQILLTNGLLIIATLELLRLASLKSSSRLIGFVRVMYPAVYLGWGWNALNNLVPIFFGNFWGTDLIIAADKFIFGVHPTVWFQQFQTPWLDELMCIFYVGYYLFMPTIMLSFFFCKKEKEALAVFSLSVLTYFVNFICFYLLPTLGPQVVSNLDGFGTNTFSGYYLANLLRQLQENGSVIGAAFPSSHVSGAFIWSLATKRYAPKWGNMLLVFSIGVAISTVYLGYHHGMDPIFGFILGVCCYKAGVYFLNRLMSSGKILEFNNRPIRDHEIIETMRG